MQGRIILYSAVKKTKKKLNKIKKTKKKEKKKKAFLSKQISWEKIPRGYQPYQIWRTVPRLK